jgi:transposase
MKLSGDSASEYRFGLIVRLQEEGKTQKEIATLVQCSQGWVSQVLKRHRLLGASGLKVKGKAPGNAPKLTKEQMEKLKAYLVEGALAQGFPTDNWSRERISQLIKDKFGVSFHVSHSSKLTRQIGFTLQKPKTRSYRKDEEAGREWKREKLPALKKSP